MISRLGRSRVKTVNWDVKCICGTSTRNLRVCAMSQVERLVGQSLRVVSGLLYTFKASYNAVTTPPTEISRGRLRIWKSLVYWERYLSRKSRLYSPQDLLFQWLYAEQFSRVCLALDVVHALKLTFDHDSWLNIQSQRTSHVRIFETKWQKFWEE